MCKECYSENSRVTPLLNSKDCLENHEQYICGTCGRCICISKDDKRGLQRWNFPFKSFEIALLYLRTADFTRKKSCGVYEITNSNGRKSYKIFPSEDELKIYISKNNDKKCKAMKPVYLNSEYVEYTNTQVRKFTNEECEKYLSEKTRQIGV